MKLSNRYKIRNGTITIFSKLFSWIWIKALNRLFLYECKFSSPSTNSTLETKSSPNCERASTELLTTPPQNTSRRTDLEDSPPTILSSQVACAVCVHFFYIFFRDLDAYRVPRLCGYADFGGISEFLCGYFYYADMRLSA